MVTQSFLSLKFFISRLLRPAKSTSTLPWVFGYILRIPSYVFGPWVRPARTEIEGESFRLRNVYRVQHGKHHLRHKFIVCADINELFSGLGCCLFILGPCWKYALETQRTLIIDWRGNPYTRTDPKKNLFSILFEPPDPAQIGVDCIADDSINDLPLPQPILGPKGPIHQETGVVDDFPASGLNMTTMRKIIGNCIDVDFPTLMPSLLAPFYLATHFGPMGSYRPKIFSFTEGQRFYQGLKLRPEWEAMVSDFYHSRMADRPVVGVHVRHGNGEGKHREHFQSREILDFSTFIETLIDKIRRFATNRYGKRYTVFLCTDSFDVVNALESHFPSFVTRPIWRPPSGEGIDFEQAYTRSDGGVGAAVDALIDMQLLAKCDTVLITRWTAFASHVPYIMEKPGALFLDDKRTALL